jgi:hypothetical protein
MGWDGDLVRRNREGVKYHSTTTITTQYTVVKLPE